MMFRFLCVALFACSLTFVGCDEANDGFDDTNVTTTETLDVADEPATEIGIGEAATNDSVEVITETPADATVVVEEPASE